MQGIFTPPPPSALRPKTPPNKANAHHIWHKWLARLLPMLLIVAFLATWYLVTERELYPRFLVPSPASVLDKALAMAADGTLGEHSAATLGNVLAGLALGMGIGVLLGYAIAKVRLLENLLAPFIVALQSTPIVAYAPLLIIWFGTGAGGKIAISALVVFFPVLMNTVVAVRGVPQDWHDILRSFNATPLDVLLKLELPATLPSLLSSFKTSATLAVIGAVVGEFVSTRVGLGFLVQLGRNQYDTPLVFVAVLAMTAIALGLYSVGSLLEWRWLQWQRRMG